MARKNRKVKLLVKALLEGKVIDIDSRKTFPALLPYLKELEQKGHKVKWVGYLGQRRMKILLDKPVIPLFPTDIVREEDLFKKLSADLRDDF